MESPSETQSESASETTSNGHTERVEVLKKTLLYGDKPVARTDVALVKLEQPDALYRPTCNKCGSPVTAYIKTTHTPGSKRHQYLWHCDADIEHTGFFGFLREPALGEISYG